jgi:hypothetical protein
MDEKGLIVRPGDRHELLVRRTLEGRVRSVLHLAHGVLAPQPTKPAQSTGGERSEGANGGLGGDAHEDPSEKAVLEL